nr:MAG: hypothetical protein DIU60_10960 [Actinomycetota bacterium]
MGRHLAAPLRALPVFRPGCAAGPARRAGPPRGPVAGHRPGGRPPGRARRRECRPRAAGAVPAAGVRAGADHGVAKAARNPASEISIPARRRTRASRVARYGATG